jgi:succinoglycan biosynthesis protein ExoA
MAKTDTLPSDAKKLPFDQRQVLIVIPTFNEERHIESTIRALMGEDADMLRATFVVADGGSSDETCAIVEGLFATFPNLVLIHNPHKLQSAAVNLAVDQVALQHHRYLVRCDAHSLYPDDYVTDVARILYEKDVASVATVMDATHDTCFARAAAWIVDTRLGSGGSAHRGGSTSGFVDHGHHAGMRLDWFRKIGGYDPTFSHNEDAEYDRRLGIAGGVIWLAADIRLLYYMRPTIGLLWKQYYRYGQGRATTVLKHRMRPRLRQMIPVVNVILIAISLVLYWVSPLFLFWPILYSTVLVFASIWMLFRHRAVCALWSGPALAAMHIGWSFGFLKGALGKRWT